MEGVRTEQLPEGLGGEGDGHASRGDGVAGAQLSGRQVPVRVNAGPVEDATCLEEVDLLLGDLLCHGGNLGAHL